MKFNYKQEQEVNFVGKTLTDFVDYYNQNIPPVFPRATAKALEKFQTDHPGLFDDSKLWTIDKHRRRLMDWLQSYQETV
ncbi:MAG: hypothetical protein A2607_01930 [Candidatus Vogelbacteria bacterium RIFOXYD1_FULL_42_15]|uniref:Uncharacterized protein n=1 Tax=Candidatus Vogelbacteria bacterium RIFOXYD1_FULL_42_15 TaxID=1802437 RepID=A0A1G2QIB2_9BACT|nr:MAG: hypothetical protein A2607_01930 [Candidatus Vogelbacteria bacterium RIFOXYD1_FULL_42_15]